MQRTAQCAAADRQAVSPFARTTLHIFLAFGLENMSTRQIHVFISHAWAYSEHYETLAKWIFEERWSIGQASLDFRDYSIPKNNPIHNVFSTKALREAIFNKIARSHVIVIPTGMYVTHIVFQINNFQVGSSSLLIFKTFFDHNGSYLSESL